MYVHHIGKKVKIIDIDNQVFVGDLVCTQRDYDGDDNAEELDVVLENGVYIEFHSDEIKSLQVI